MKKVSSIKSSKIKEIKFERHTNPELITGLCYIADEAIAGHGDGAVIALRKNGFHHEIMILGSYNQDPYAAIRAIEKLKKACIEKIYELESDAMVEINI